MADAVSLSKRTQTRFIDRVRASWQAATGIELPVQHLMPGNGLASFSGTEPPPDAFATGYDGTETTTSFLFGLSLLGGEDVLT